MSTRPATADDLHMQDGVQGTCAEAREAAGVIVGLDYHDVLDQVWASDGG